MQKRYFLYLLIISITVGLGIIIGFYLAQNYYGDVQSRIQNIEKQFAANLKPGQEIKMDELKVYVDKQTGTIKDQFDLAMRIGLPGTIIALLASIFLAYNWAAEIAKAKAEEAFKDPETLIKENRSILVLTPDNESVEFLYSFFQTMGFKTPTFKKLTEIESLKGQYFDLAILNVPEDLPLTDSRYNDNITHMTMAKSVFYFGKGRVKNTKFDDEGRLSFANAKSQLYGNLINALKFQKML
jgi:hypothetical protein